jgi:hypothetical protein
VKEPAEMEVASVFEEVATRNAVIADAHDRRVNRQ